MSGWDEIYRQLEADGALEVTERQLDGTAWLDEFIPQLGEPGGESLDLGCGLGADMLRYAQLGWQVTGVDLSSRAVDHVQRLGFEAVRADMAEDLPFEDGRFDLVTGRCSLHFLPPGQTRRLFREIRRVLAPGGRLLFIVNSERHRALGLQYDYHGAKQLEANYWELPRIGRRYLFYTPRLASDLLGEGWRTLLLEERPFRQWEIEKYVVVCLAERDREYDRFPSASAPRTI